MAFNPSLRSTSQHFPGSWLLSPAQLCRALLLCLLLLLASSCSNAFEFDVPSDPARQFGPSQGGGSAASQRVLFADPDANEDNAGFVGGLPVSARRRLIQPPPLKRAAMAAQRMDWLLAGLRPRAD